MKEKQNMEQKLLDIAQELHFIDLYHALQNIQQREDQPNCPLILPLVGEFSSGKTTLLNSLMDSKGLETATQPTTATIYEIFFGSNKCYAKVINENNQHILVENIANLKNTDLANAKLVQVYDTSDKVPNGIVFVDTPGLSSTDIKHRQNLVNFLPQADAMLLVVDINQQLTNSTIQFIKTMSLSKRPIYLILTKSDTKSPQESEDSKQYILNRHRDLSFADILCVSAATNDLSAFYTLLSKIQADKNNILKQVNAARVQGIVKQMKEKLNILIQSTCSDNEAEKMLSEQYTRLQQLHNSLTNLAADVKEDIRNVEEGSISSFKKSIFSQLDHLVTTNRRGYDQQAIAIINNTASIVSQGYKDKVRQCLYDYTRQKINAQYHFSSNSLSQIDVSAYQLNTPGYSLQLNEVGHEYDTFIATTTKIAGKAALAYFTGGASATPEVNTALTDVGTSEVIAAQVVESGINVKDLTALVPNSIVDNLVSALVWNVTDQVMGKPERQRAIHNYIDGTLLPTFQQELNRISQDIIEQTQTLLTQEAKTDTQQITQEIERLKNLRHTQEAEFKKQMQTYKEYQTFLTNYKEDTK